MPFASQSPLVQRGPIPKKVGFLRRFFERYDRRHAIAPDSAETYGNTARTARAEKRVSFRGVLKRHLSVVWWRSRERLEFPGMHSGFGRL